MRRIGVISDTHGLLRPQALAALEGSELILHAGDVGPPAILDPLRSIAPVHAVFGNTDHGPTRAMLPRDAVVDLGASDGHPTDPPSGPLAYVTHIPDEVEVDPSAAGFALVLTGHTHVPMVERRQGVLWLNPGSAGPRRFSLPVTVAHLTVAVDGGLEARIVELDV